MEIIQLIFEALTTISTSVIDWFSSMFGGIATIFYTPGVGEVPATLTLFGVLSLVGVGVGAFYFILRWLTSLIRVKTQG